MWAWSLELANLIRLPEGLTCLFCCFFLLGKALDAEPLSLESNRSVHDVVCSDRHVCHLRASGECAVLLFACVANRFVLRHPRLAALKAYAETTVYNRLAVLNRDPLNVRERI